MPTYQYKARDKIGNLLQGKIDVPDERTLRKILTEKNYFIVEYEEKKRKRLLSFELFKWQKIDLRTLSLFSWHLFTMLNAGLSLINSLIVIEKQTKETHLKKAIGEVTRQVEGGSSFSEALGKQKGIFTSLFAQMVHAGEIGGVLDEMVRRLALYFERQSDVRTKMRAALIYPLLLMTISLGVIIFLLTYVLPRYVTIFEDIDAPIPAPTQVMLAISSGMQNYWYMIVGGALIGIVVFLMGIRTRVGRRIFDTLQMRLPIIGAVTNKKIASQFADTLAILLSSGVPLLVALDVVLKTINNTVVLEVLQKVVERVKDGKTIAEPLEESKIFPEMVVSMIHVGEETGELDMMLVKVGEFYTRDVDYFINNFTKIIEPLLIVLMTFVIGFIAITIFLPLSDIMQGLY